MVENKVKYRSKNEYKDKSAYRSKSAYSGKSDYIKKSTNRKQKRGISIPLVLAVVFSLVIITLVSISTFEWLRNSFLNSRIFTLKEISIQGNHRISLEDIKYASRLNIGEDSIYSNMPHITEKRIKSLSRYLEQVQVERKFSLRRSEGMGGWVNITVKEREPAALVSIGQGADSFIVVDAHGFAVERVTADPYTGPKSSYGDNLPVVVGIDVRDLKLGVENELPELKLALNVLEDARSVIPELFDKISCIDARDQDNIVLRLQTHSVSLASGNQPVSETDILIASDRIEEGMRSILPVIMKRMEEAKETEYIDARFPGAIYCGEKLDKQKNSL